MKRLAIALLLFAAPLTADYQQAYRTGVTAYSKNRWQETVSAMQDAIRERPAESSTTVFIYGTWYEPYIPQYYLGMSLFRLGRCAEAVKPLEESLRQKAIPRNYVSKVDDALARCAASAPAPAEKEPATATMPPAVVPVPVPMPVTPSTATTTTAPIITTTSSDRDAKRVAASRELLAALDRARNLVEALPRNASPREAALLKTRIRRAEAALVSASPDEQNAATRNLAASSSGLETWLRTRTAPAEPPRQLVSAVQAYLSGHYGSSLTALDAAVFTDDRARAQGMLFRAAATHALFVIGHSRDRDLYAKAVSAIREYKKLQRNPELDARVFSPAFVKFVQEAGS